MPMELANDEEKVLIDKVVLMPFVLRDLNDDKAVIERMANTLRGNYVEAIEYAYDRAHSDVIEARKELQRRKIAVYGERKDNIGITYTYKVRGWEHKGLYGWERVESLVRGLLRRYLTGDLADLAEKFHSKESDNRRYHSEQNSELHIEIKREI